VLFRSGGLDPRPTGEVKTAYLARFDALSEPR